MKLKRIGNINQLNEDLLQEDIQHVFTGMVVLLKFHLSDIVDEVKPQSEVSDQSNSLEYVVDGSHPFVITNVDYDNKTFLARLMTSKYAEKKDWQKQYYFPIPKDKDTGLNTEEGKISAITLYNITPELPFNAIHKCVAYLNDEIMHEFFLAERHAMIHPLLPMKVYEKYR